jgi:hypothetical protein
MTKLRFFGSVLSEHVKITIYDHPTLYWKNAEMGIEAKFDLRVQDNNITLEFESNKGGQEHIQEAVIRAVDITQASFDLIAFREAEGVTAVLNRIEFEDGTTNNLVCAEPALRGLATAIGDNGSFVTVLRMMLVEPRLLLAIRDLADSLKTLHTGPINCGRAMDAICNYFIPEGGERKYGWKPMRDALNLDETYLRSISDLSKGPRHGNRIIEADSQVRPVGIKAWKIMNRFLEYRKRGNQSLPPDDFPLLCD